MSRAMAAGRSRVRRAVKDGRAWARGLSAGPVAVPALTPDPSSAWLKKSPQTDIVRRTIITDDRKRSAHQGGRPESRGQLRQRLRGFEGTSRRLWMRRGIMRCDAGTGATRAPGGGRTEFVFPTNIMPPFVLLLGRQAVFTHVVFQCKCILLLKMPRGLRSPP